MVGALVQADRPLQPTEYGSTLPAPGDSAELADVVESFGLRQYHFGLLLVAWILQLCPSSTVMTTPFVLRPVRKEYGVSNAAVALVGSALTSGAVIGVFLFGPLNDRIGRKRANSIAVLGIGVLAGLHFFLPAGRSQGMEADWHAFGILLMLRIFLGIFFAGSASFWLLLFVEFLSSRRRGLMMIIASVGWSLGTLYSIWVASTFEGHFRMILAAPVMVCAIAIVVLQLSPESPRWLFVVGREDEGHRVLERVLESRMILAPTQGIKARCSLSERVHISGQDTREEAEFWADLRALFGPKLWRITTCTVLIHMSVHGASYVMLIWSPELLQQLLGANRIPYEIFAIAEIAGWLGTLCTAWFLDGCGRRPTLAGALFLTAATMVALAKVPRRYNWVMATYGTQQFVSGGMWPAMTTYTAECFPTALRGTGGSICQGLGRLTAVLLPILLGAVVDGGGIPALGIPALEAALYITSATYATGAVFAALIPQETANAKMQDV